MNQQTRILHYSDKTSQEFPSLYDQCDILVTTGDLTYFDLQYIETVRNKKTAFGVYGNHDSGQYFEKLGIINLHDTVYQCRGLLWGGFQGCLQYKKTGIMFTEQEAEAWLSRFPRVDVLLLHAGPCKMLDDPSDPVHIGSKAIRKYVLEKKPRYVFCGHQYEQGEMNVQGIRLYRTYGARMFNITTGIQNSA